MEIQVRPVADAPAMPLAEGGGVARALIWPGMGSRYRTFHHFLLYRDQRSVIHCHRGAEAVYYVIAGSGWVEDLDLQERQPVAAGQMFHITPGTRYRMVPKGSIELIGGPCPPDPHIYGHGGET